ncbi:acyl-CoA dehydrogenase [Phreatobacter aquaticus]|uniref:Acyl-CoA dehydrogenase n=1 Tax=Phreatobacter aquaticus TaxID=2570229 RepID=A0A4D7QGH8_9HYPH|nr:acyl-CoA dehydrogenase family protein [Phreatobacter aquaticus]QCK84556.1 acyl-CoA dehydrogenase [Phreatobacter aquaticus]
MDDLIASSAARLFAEAASPEVIRRLTDHGSASALWADIQQSGFLDALVPEDQGGAGLSLPAVLPILLEAGRHAVPLPVGATIVARALAVRAGINCPEGPIAIASGSVRSDAVLSADVPGGAFADAVLVADGDRFRLLHSVHATASASGEGTFHRMAWRADAVAEAPLLAGVDLMTIGARLEAAEMAGAIETIFAMTLTYANDRSQFGRPIGKFQAVQQQLAVMTELVHAARAAADLAFPEDADITGSADLARIATAKIRIGEAAAQAAGIAHAVHGAIGMTQELNLHLFVERLRQGRLRYGSERLWSARLGQMALSQTGGTMLDFVRARIA